MPTSLDLTSSGMQDRSVALIAQALLNAGVLQESDYIGALRECVNIGLRRWSADSGCENLSHFDDLALAWGDSIDAVGLFDQVWFQRCVLDKPVTRHATKTESRKIGYFALASTSHNDLDASGAEALVIGPRIEALMGIAGRATGWRVCRVLQSALGTSGVALTPASIREMPGDDYLNYDEDWTDASPEAEENDIMTTSRFDRGQPIQACEWCRDEDARLLRRDRARLKRRMQSAWALEQEAAQKHASLTQILELSGRGVGGHNSAITWAFNVVAVAADLGALIERRFLNVGEGAYYRHMLNPIGMMRPRVLPSHVIRWSMADNVERVFDDYWNRLMQDEATPLTTVLPFIADLPGDGPGSLPFAVEALRELIPIVVLCDALLDLLHEMDTPASEGGTGIWPPGTKRPGAPRSKRQRIQIRTDFGTQNPMLALRGRSFEPRSAVDALRLQQQSEARNIEVRRDADQHRVAQTIQGLEEQLLLLRQEDLGLMETEEEILCRL